MNAGFGSVTLLKSLVLPVSLRAQSGWDDALARLGRGVVAQFEQFTGRTFGREADAEFFCDAARKVVSLPRYPLEEVSEIALRLSLEAGYEAQTDVIANTDLKAGLVILSQPLGSIDDQIRVTYTGGFWWDTTEDSSGTLPTGAATVPDDLITAWMMQVQHAAQQTNLFTTQAIDVKKANVAEYDLIPAVKRTLLAHIRYT